MKMKGALLIFLIVAAMSLSFSMEAGADTICDSIKDGISGMVDSVDDMITDYVNELRELKVDIKVQGRDRGDKTSSRDLRRKDDSDRSQNDQLVKTVIEILEETGLKLSSIDGFAITPIGYYAPANLDFNGFSKVGAYRPSNSEASDEIINIDDLTKSVKGYIDTDHAPEIAYDRRSFRVDMKDGITEKDIRSILSRNVYRIIYEQGIYGVSLDPKNKLAADTARAVEIESKEDANADRFHFLYIFKTSLEDVYIVAEFDLNRSSSVRTRADLSIYLKADGMHVFRKRPFDAAAGTTVDDIMKRIKVDRGLGVMTFSVDPSKVGLKSDADLDGCLKTFMIQFDFISPQMSSQPDAIKRYYPKSLMDEKARSAVDEGDLINMIKGELAYQGIDIIADDGTYIDVSTADGRAWRISVTEISNDAGVDREVAAR